MEKISTNSIANDVDDYLTAYNGSQEAIQTARRELKQHRLGRAARTEWERQQVAVVYESDRLLQTALSATLRRNKRNQDDTEEPA